MEVIMHVDMDAFFAAVEQLYRPELRGTPVIVGGDPDGRSVVSAASYEARAYGIHSAMPMAWARKLCPHGIFLSCDGKKYGQISRIIFSILEEFTPDVEKASVDEAYLDVTGCDRLFGPPLALAHTIRTTIQERLGLSASIGVASSRSVAKIASDLAKPAGILLVPAGREAAFLAPLPVGRMPGIGKTTGGRLTAMGVRTLGDLTQMEDVLLERVFGKYGPMLREKALGKNRDGVRETAPRKSMGKEITFPRDIVDRADVETALAALAEKVCQKLRREGLAARTITVKLRYSDFKTVSRSCTFRSPAQYDSIVIPAVWDLFRRLDSRRTGIRLVGVSASRLQTGIRQRSLLEGPAERKREKFYKGVDAVRDRFGFSSIGMASRCHMMSRCDISATPVEERSAEAWKRRRGDRADR